MHSILRMRNAIQWNHLHNYFGVILPGDEGSEQQIPTQKSKGYPTKSLGSSVILQSHWPNFWSWSGENMECGVWKRGNMVNVENEKWRVESMQYGKHGMWEIRSMENVELTCSTPHFPSYQKDLITFFCCLRAYCETCMGGTECRFSKSLVITLRFISWINKENSKGWFQLHWTVSKPSPHKHLTHYNVFKLIVRVFLLGNNCLIFAHGNFIFLKQILESSFQWPIYPRQSSIYSSVC